MSTPVTVYTQGTGTANISPVVTLNNIPASNTLNYPIGQLAIVHPSGAVYMLVSKTSFNGSLQANWTQLSNGNVGAISTTNLWASTQISGLTETATLIYTTQNNGQKFYPSIFRIIATTLTGTSGSLRFSIGTNSASYNNLVVSGPEDSYAEVQGQYIQAPGVESLLETSPGPGFFGFPLVPPNTGIYANVTTALSGTTATLTIETWGNYSNY